MANDNGQTDLLDFQYFLFNLVTLAYFFISFFVKFKDGVPEESLKGQPPLPDTLLALSGASAAIYAFKKALESHPGPVISAVSPTVIPANWTRPIVITGTGFSGFSSLWSFPPAKPTGSAHISDSPVYQRGAMVLHKIRRAVGDDTFYDIIQGWAATHRHGNANTADFTAYVEKQAPDEDFDAIWRDWLYGDGKPARP